MPNFYNAAWNDLIMHGREISDYLSGAYMEPLENQLLSLGENRIQLGGMQFFRILQYRRVGSAQDNFGRISKAFQTALTYCGSYGSALAWTIASNDGEIGIYLGVEEISVEPLKQQLSALIADIAFANGFMSDSELNRLTRYSGIIGGNIACEGPIADTIISSLQRKNSMITLLAVPMEEWEAGNYTNGLLSLKMMTESLLQQDTYGRGYRRTYPGIADLDNLLDQMIENLEISGTSLWKTCLWFGCERMQDLQVVGSSLTSAINAADDAKAQLARTYYTTESFISSGSFFLPEAIYGEMEYTLPDALFKPSLLDYTSAKNVASFCQLPSDSVPGFEVIQLEKSQDDVSLFNRTAPARAENAIQLGNIEDSRSKYALPVNRLTGHMLIAGTTGSGKTNTVMRLIHGAESSHIPTLIVESSKKEYWHLAATNREMQIYSFGRDADLLPMNPLMPEEGVIIGNHIDSILYAFSGAFEMEEPTRLALDGLIRYAYRQYGWETWDTVWYGGRPFPTIQTLLELLPEYSKQELVYGQEVAGNIVGSLRNRLLFLTSGVMGEAFANQNPISGGDLCNGTVLVELNELSIEAKPFIAMLLMIKVDQYLRQQNETGNLQQVIVLEEAHNIFADPERQRSQAKALASEYFSNMLSQIRAYGVGMIIADQGPSQLHPAAVANTNIKIIHRLQTGSDVDRLRGALNLTDLQQRNFPFLQTGEAVCAIGGEYQVVKVKVDQNTEMSFHNMACAFCPQRIYCPDYNKSRELSNARRSMYAQQLFAVRNQPMQLKETLHQIVRYVGWSMDDELCLAGILLEDPAVRAGDLEKRRILNRLLG